MKPDIDSMFFEFQKMRAFLQMGVGMHLGGFRFVGLRPAQDYANSLLLVDLYSIVDEALQIVFASQGLDSSMKLDDKMLVLEERGLLTNAPYLKWYKEWRNAIAHRRRRIEYFELAQACDEVKNQLVFWKMATDLEFRHYYDNSVEDVILVGSRIESIPVLEFRVQYVEQPGGKSPSWGETVNLTLHEYLNKCLEFKK